MKERTEASIGRRIYKLTIESVDRDRGYGYVLAKCDCGNIKSVWLPNVKRGMITSCGCVKYSQKNLSSSREYASWNAMWSRCTNPKDISFINYGARGIWVCDRWRSFSWFLHDMGPRPKGTTIDRWDTNGNYEPGNCRWATKLEQDNNRRTNTVVLVHGESMSLMNASRRLGFNYMSVMNKMRRKNHPKTAQQCVDDWVATHGV